MGAKRQLHPEHEAAFIPYTSQVWMVSLRRTAATGISIPEEIPTDMAQPTPATLTNEEITHLLTLLRNTASPLTTQQLVDALKSRTERA